MPITIMVDAYLITLRLPTYRIVDRTVQVGRITQTRRERVKEMHEVPPRQNATGVAQAFVVANQILGPAQIVFRVRSTSSKSVEMPGDSEVVNDQGFLFLAKQFPGRGGASALFVSRFQAAEEGGMAAEDKQACIVASLGQPLTGNTLAHEFGHLLGLDHIKDYYNLMYKGLRAGHKLTAEQITKATSSKLARSGLRTA